VIVQVGGEQKEVQKTASVKEEDSGGGRRRFSGMFDHSQKRKNKIRTPHNRGEKKGAMKRKKNRERYDSNGRRTIMQQAGEKCAGKKSTRATTAKVF